MPLEPATASAVAPVIAYLLLGDPLPDRDRAALYRRALPLLPSWAESGPWDALRELVFSARRDALNATSGNEVRQAALALIGAFDEREIAERLVRSAHVLGHLSNEVNSLLQAAGGQSLWAIGRHLECEPHATVNQALLAFSQGLGADAWRRALESCGSRSATEVLPLLPLIAGLPPGLARPAARTLSQHPGPLVRQRALTILFGITPWDPATRQMVEAGLLGNDPIEADIARAAVSRLEHPDLALLDLALSETAPSPVRDPLRQRLVEKRRAIPHADAEAAR